MLREDRRLSHSVDGGKLYKTAVKKNGDTYILPLPDSLPSYSLHSDRRRVHRVKNVMPMSSEATRAVTSSIIYQSKELFCRDCIYYNEPIHGNEIHCAVNPTGWKYECDDYEEKVVINRIKFI